MRALALTVRFRELQFEADACLLVYDELSLQGTTVGDDIRDLLDRQPNTPNIFVLAPFLPVDSVKESIKAGTGAQRASSATSGVTGQLSVIGIRKSPEHGAEAFITPLTVNDDVVSEGPEKPLSKDLLEGWLFDLFDKSKARIDAPPGVHFGKMSGKHSDKFLRTSAALLSTRACAVMAFFALASIKVRDPRRIFVDTAPLLSVALAMQRIAIIHKIWDVWPPAQSFSSYGGLESADLPTFGKGDVFLISASTTGGLAKHLINTFGADDGSVATLFRLDSDDSQEKHGAIVCDLTYLPGKTYGYSKIKNHAYPGCTLCAKGFVLASLEGDQFLVEKLGVKRVRMVRTSQTDDARNNLHLFAKKQLLHVNLFRGNRPSRTDIAVDVEGILNQSEVRDAFKRLLVRFTPTPLSYIVLCGLSLRTFNAMVAEAGLTSTFATAKRVLAEEVATLTPVQAGNVLVAIGYLHDHAEVRTINAQLRLKAPRGCVSYLAALTIVDSARNLASLRNFLSWGELGRDTFIYRGALELMLPQPAESQSAWDRELELLQRLVSDGGALAPELSSRLDRLQSNSKSANSIFLPGLTGETRISPDFVYLDTKENAPLITQADVYTAVSNVWACAKNDNVGLLPDPKRSNTVEWQKTAYGNIVLCPSNFSDYNDAVLRAALLRLCSPDELCYAVDEKCSTEILEICLAELANWSFGKGDALPEFLLAMATKRLTLRSEHARSFKSAADQASLQNWLLPLVARIAED